MQIFLRESTEMSHFGFLVVCFFRIAHEVKDLKFYSIISIAEF